MAVDYSTRDGTARGGLDYENLRGTLVFADGETNRSITVRVHDDDLSEDDESFELILSQPTNGAMIGTNAIGTLVILDNDRPGTLDFSFALDPGVCRDAYSDEVTGLSIQPDGRILVGGHFSSALGASTHGLVRLLSDGSLDPSFTAALPIGQQSWAARHVVGLPDGRILLGAVSGAAGESNLLARLNRDGSFDSSFGIIRVQKSPPEMPSVDALVLQPDGGIVLGGSFDRVRSFGRKNLVRVKPDGTVDPAWVAEATNTPGASRILTLASYPDGKLLIGGVFDHINGVSQSAIARLKADGGLDVSFTSLERDPVSGATPAYSVRRLAIQSDDRVLVAGDYQTADGFSTPFLVRLGSTGIVDTNFTAVLSSGPTDPPPMVSAMAQQPDGGILIAGRFVKINGVFRRNLARLNPDGSVDHTFRSNEVESSLAEFWRGDELRALAIQADGQVIAGGKFLGLDDQARCGVKRINGLRLRVEDFELLADGRWRIRFHATPGARYAVVTSPDLQQWTVLGAPLELAPGSFEFLAPAASGRSAQFYRVRSQ